MTPCSVHWSPIPPPRQIVLADPSWSSPHRTLEPWAAALLTVCVCARLPSTRDTRRLSNRPSPPAWEDDTTATELLNHPFVTTSILLSEHAGAVFVKRERTSGIKAAGMDQGRAPKHTRFKTSRGRGVSLCLSGVKNQVAARLDPPRLALIERVGIYVFGFDVVNDSPHPHEASAFGL